MTMINNRELLFLRHMNCSIKMTVKDYYSIFCFKIFFFFPPYSLFFVLFPENKTPSFFSSFFVSLQVHHSLFATAASRCWNRTVLRHQTILFDIVLSGAAAPALVLVEPPHVTAQAILIPKHLVAVLAGDVAGLGLVHVPDVTGEGVPGQLLIAVWTRLLLGHCPAPAACGGGAASAVSGGRATAECGRG